MEDDIIIDKYLKGLLLTDEETLFLTRLDADADFKAQFELEKQLFEALNEDTWSFADNKNSAANDYATLLKEDDLQNLKKTLAEANIEFNSEDSKGVGPRKLLYYLAAASIVVFLGFRFFFNQNTTNNQDLYNNYVALNDLPSFVSRGDSTDQLAKAQSLFENKKYQDALAIFQANANASEDKANVLIYQGLAETELEKYNDAENTFNVLINSDLLDAQKGYWYKALLFLKIDRVEEAQELLNTTVSKSFYNQEKAKQLLRDLE